MKQSTETFKINLLDIIIFLNYLFFVLRHLTSRPGTHYVAQAVLEPTEICLASARITGVCLHNWLGYVFLMCITDSIIIRVKEDNASCYFNHDKSYS